MTTVNKIAMTAILFLIVTLHVLIFGLARWPGTFISAEFAENPILFKVILYVSAIVVSCLHQPITRRFGLKKALIGGLSCNIIALILILVHHFWTSPLSYGLLYLTTIVLGLASLSVLNCLITFIILAYPQRTVLGISALFAFANGGLMLTPLVLRFAKNWDNILIIFYAVFALQAIFIWFVKALFEEPAYPKKLEHLRSGTLLWKEMYHRLSFYILSIVCYALAESTFSHWGRAYLQDVTSVTTSQNGVAFFWCMMIVSQILLLIPLYFFEPMKLFYYLIAFAAMGLAYIPMHESAGFIYLGFALGAIGCSVIFPIVLSVMEMEIIRVTFLQDKEHFLPLIETAISFVMAGYMLGSAIIDFWAESANHGPPSSHLYLGIFFILGTALIVNYLDRTRLNNGILSK